jgi:Mrp family chromosome partitioning ATPase
MQKTIRGKVGALLDAPTPLRRRVEVTNIRLSPRHGDKADKGATERAIEHATEISLGRERTATPNILASPKARVDMYDALRHVHSRILASMPSDGHTVIAVSSALEGEGKTTVALALAELLADEYSRQTILVDANLQKPQLHSLLDTEASPGLKDCLSAHSLITSAIRWTGRVWVMPAGIGATVLPDGPENPSELFRTLRSLFRVTIVDMTAVNSRHSASLMPLWADGIVWVVKADSSPADLVMDAMELVGKDNILGVVLNGHRSRLPRWLDRLL